jgi:hypothetical protein
MIEGSAGAGADVLVVAGSRVVVVDVGAVVVEVDVFIDGDVVDELGGVVVEELGEVRSVTVLEVVPPAGTVVEVGSAAGWRAAASCNGSTTGPAPCASAAVEDEVGPTAEVARSRPARASQAAP